MIYASGGEVVVTAEDGSTAIAELGTIIESFFHYDLIDEEGLAIIVSIAMKMDKEKRNGKKSCH